MYLITVVIAFITLLNIIVHYLRQVREEERDRRNLCRRFSLAEIKSATQDFDEALIIGKGGFGKVYIGIIENVLTTVAIKRLVSGSEQGAPEFWTEIEMLSKFRHSNLVSLIGYCNDHHERIIVYEYMPRGTLEENLLKKIRCCDASTLSWVQRLKICIGAARGLDYLHTGTSTQHRVIQRDVKSSNILLDENMEARLSDFGLSKIGPTNQPCTHVKGTFGYLDPEYLLTRRLTRKSDVYAFGVVLFEVLCGRPAVDVRLYEEQRSLAGWATHCVKERKIDLLVDPSLMGSILPKCLEVFSQIAGRCLQDSSKRRPTMAEVISKLEFALELQERENSRVDELVNIAADGAQDNQHSMYSYAEQEMIRDSFTEQEVVNTHSNGYTDGETNRILQSGGTSGVQSHERPSEKMTFLKKVRMFFIKRSQCLR